MQITFKGVIRKAFPKASGVSQRTGSSWSSQEFLIEEEGQQYNQSLVFKVFGEDRLASLSLNEGDRVTAYLNFSTRPWQDRVFTQIDCYKVVREGEEAPTQQQGQAPAQQAAPTAQPAAPAPQPSVSAQQQAAPEPDPLGGDATNDEDSPF